MIRDWAGFLLLLTLLVLAMLRSGLESATRHVPRRPVRAPRPAPKHRKTKAPAMAGKS